VSIKFSKANSKLVKLYKVQELQKWLEGKRKVYSLDLLSGHNCPFANECLSKAVERADGSRHIQDGPNTQFRCFSASQEAQYPNVYNPRKANSDTLRDLCDLYDEYTVAQHINDAMPKDLGICRIHVAGDFFRQKYFNAWIIVAKANPDKLFYAYTKSLVYWLRMRDEIPSNLVLTASRGGSRDDLIVPHGLREAVVVFSEKEADEKFLGIDEDDSHAAVPEWREDSFALLIHGTQPKGTEAAEALKVIKAEKRRKKQEAA
tara:strand:+ start:658 stop:1440 length:783 start_codon:yes stop_codon:yes gene_type:complete